MHEDDLSLVLFQLVFFQESGITMHLKVIFVEEL